MDTIAQSFRVVHAEGGDWEDLTGHCLAQLGPAAGTASLGFVYVTDSLDEDLDRIVERLRRETRIDHWVGTVGLGVCAGDRELFDLSAMAVMVAALPQESFCILPSLTRPDQPLPTAVARWVADKRPLLGVVHADPHTPALDGLLAAIQEKTGCFLVGGVSASRGALAQVADAVVEGGVSGVLFGPEVAAVTGLTQGCSPIGPAHRVTEGRDNVIAALDHRPAFEVFCEDIGELLARDLRRVQGYVHAAIPLRGSDRADYLVRNLLGVYPEQGWLSVGERLSVGDSVMFVRRDGASALADLKRMVHDVRYRAGAPPRAALYFSCVARGPNLFGHGAVELGTVATVLGEAPLIGFYANGEISNGRLYGYTGVLVFLM